MVRVDALAELYAAAVEQPAARGIYNGVERCGGAVRRDRARRVARGAAATGPIEHLTLESARAAMGGFADALALDLQMSAAKAQRELGWSPHRPTVLEELANTVVP